MTYGPAEASESRHYAQPTDPMQMVFPTLGETGKEIRSDWKSPFAESETVQSTHTTGDVDQEEANEETSQERITSREEWTKILTDILTGRHRDERNFCRIEGVITTTWDDINDTADHDATNN